MLTRDPTTMLDQLLNNSIADFDIPLAVHQLAERRYRDLGDWLADYWKDDTDGVIYPQGSFRLGTVVQPITPQAEYDIDLVCRRDLTKEATTQQALKADVGQAIADYVATGPDGRPRRREGKRCWTLVYPSEPFHMDTLPSIPNVAAAPNGIWLTDRELRLWQPSNPVDYASWFHLQMEREYVAVRETLAKQMDVDDVPAWYVKTTLQRAVQALKRHRDLCFADRPDERPASIIITTLAARAYEGGGLHDVLVDVTAKMPGLIENRDGVWWVSNPVQPDENFADRWQREPERAERFFSWLAQAHDDFVVIGAELGLDRILSRLASNFGQRAADHAGETLGSGLSQARGGGRLGIAGTAATLGQAVRKPVPQHTFHGGTRPTRP